MAESIASRLMSGEQPGDVDRKGRCVRCKGEVLIPGHLWESAKLWNREHAKDVDEWNRAHPQAPPQRPQFITGGDLVVCDPCTPAYREEREEEERRVYYTTTIYLRDLRAGRYSPEAVRWLREHGHRAEVDRILNEEGTNGR